MSSVNSTRSPTFADVMNHLIDYRLRALGGALPGNVVSYDPSSQTASVRPGVHRITPTDTEDFAFELLPIVHRVPVCWPRGRNFRIEGTLLPGDPVLLVCLDRDASGWLETGKASEPVDLREGTWASAVAVPGLVPDTDPFTGIVDAPALASRVDAIGRAISVLTPPATPADAPAVVAAIIAAFKAVYPAPAATVGSTVVKISG